MLAKDRQILAFGDLALVLSLAEGIPSEHIEGQYPPLSLLHVKLINDLFVVVEDGVRLVT